MNVHVQTWSEIQTFHKDVCAGFTAQVEGWSFTQHSGTHSVLMGAILYIIILSCKLRRVWSPSQPLTPVLLPSWLDIFPSSLWAAAWCQDMALGPQLHKYIPSDSTSLAQSWRGWRPASWLEPQFVTLLCEQGVKKRNHKQTIWYLWEQCFYKANIWQVIVEKAQVIQEIQ